MWFFIAARRGRKQQQHLRRIRKPVEAIAYDLIGEWESAQRSNDVLKNCTQEHFRLAHLSAKMYTLEGEAYELFRKSHDELVQEKQKTKDENVQGILSKARGYLARIV